MIRTRHNGFTLLEVMVSMLLGLLVVGMVVNLFINTKKNHAQNARVTDVLENGRFALRMLSNDLKNVGFMGGVWEMSNISLDSTISLSADCGQASETNWAYDVSTYAHMQFKYNINGTSAASQFKCITAADFKTNSDVLAIKRSYTQKDTGALTNNMVYLRSDYTSGCFWYRTASNPAPTGSSCPTSNYEDWRYLVNVYYIRPYTTTVGDGIPSLCKKYLGNSGGSSPTPAMTDVCLAEGIEHFHVQIGLDTDATRDGVANQFVSDPTEAEVTGKAVAARIFILARADREDPTFTNNKTYTMGDRTVTVNDKYFRRMYTTTVILRNPRNVSVFNNP